jgi:acetyltransferase-like isoleucine patch superfamily enzyme
MVTIIQFIYNKISFFIWYIRTMFWKLFFKEIGKNTYIMKNCTFYSPSGIKIWKNWFININCIFDWKWDIDIWDNVSFAPNVRIRSFNHIFKDINIPINIQWNEYKKVIIWSNVWVGDGSIILPWIRIWEWSIIAAGSIVTKDVTDFSVVWW